MASEAAEPIERWTAKRRGALVVSILTGKTSVAEAARQHGLTVAEVEEWREKFLLGVENVPVFQEVAEPRQPCRCSGGRAASGRDGHAVELEHLQHLWNIRRTGRDLLAEGAEHRSHKAAVAGDLEHLTAAGATAKAVHRAGRHVHERSGRAHDGLPCVAELDLPLEHKEGLVPVVTVEGRTHSLVTLLQGDLIGLSRSP